jgi:hypothetical protein
MRRVGAIGVGLCLLLAGCVTDEQAKLIVANPFGQPPQAQDYRALASPAPKEDQELNRRIQCVGEQVVRANPGTGLRPRFVAVGAPAAEIFHRGTEEVFITAGLVNECVTDGQLAAVICNEFGKMVAEREARTPPATRQPERTPPPDYPVGNDAGGMFGASDGVHRMELAKFERERHPPNVTIPPPAPELLARNYIQRAGYTLDDLDAAAPILRKCAANGALEKQLVGN